MLLVIMYGIIRLRVSFSNILDRKGKILIGLLEVGVSSGLSGIAKLIILENNYCTGK